MLPVRLPFYYQSHNQKGNGGFPETLPFDLDFDEELKMYRQRTTIELKEILHRVYQLGSLVDGSISNEPGSVYVDRITGFIKKHVVDNPGFSILEIGCGSGVILKSLKKITNTNIIGLEPGNHTKIHGLDNVRVIRDFFPSKQLKKKFDLIYSLLVLEHIEDPVAFLKIQAEYLNEKGKIIFAVPNCEAFLETGDISIFIHEHYSYFTRESIYHTVMLAGFSIQEISVIEGVLIVTITRSPLQNTNTYHFDKLKFESSISFLNEKILGVFQHHKENDIVIYVPGRALNTLYMAKKLNCRLVDDNSEITGKYLPVFNNPIESFESILTNPPELIFIYSRTFGERIKAKCNRVSLLLHTKVLTLNDLDQ